MTSRVPVAEQVARKLLQLIHAGSLGPDDQLPTERDLAASLHVSRASVREALRGLQILGVVKARQGGGIFVSSLEAAEILYPLQVLITLTEENVDALYESRCVIEGALGQLITSKVDDATLDTLARIVEHQSTITGDAIAFRQSDTEFHKVLRAIARNPFLERISEALYLLGMEYRRVAWETPGVLSRSVGDHRAIVAALRSRDSEKATEAMVRHMGSVYETTRSAMQDNRGSRADVVEEPGKQ